MSDRVPVRLSTCGRIAMVSPCEGGCGRDLTTFEHEIPERMCVGCWMRRRAAIAALVEAALRADTAARILVLWQVRSRMAYKRAGLLR